MKRYVLGLAFTESGVVMVQKNRPAWQAGKLNFVGGKLERGERPIDCMVREFLEETGVQTTTSDWTWFGTMARGEDSEFAGDEGDFEVFMFRTEPDKKFHLCRTVEDEEIIHVTHDKFSFDSDLNPWYISNIRTIYEFARSDDHVKQDAKMEIRYG